MNEGNHMINDFSNYMINKFNEFSNNIAKLTNKIENLEKQNEEFKNKFVLKSDYDKVLQRLNELENNFKKYQNLLNHLSIQIDGYKKFKMSSKNEGKEERMKQYEERIENITKEMKISEEETKKKEKEWVEKKKKIDEDLNSMKKRTHEIGLKTETNEQNQKEMEIEINEQFDKIYSEMLNQQQEMEQLIDSKAFSKEEKKW